MFQLILDKVVPLFYDLSQDLENIVQRGRWSMYAASTFFIILNTISLKIKLVLKEPVVA